jgi:short-subunit dehydrogenase
MKRVLIVGATSAIAHEVARRFAASGASLFLVGRNREKVVAVAEDLRVRGATAVETLVIDNASIDRHQGVFAEATAAFGALDAVLIAHGSLPDQRRCELSVEESMQAFHINCLSVISLASLAANYFEQRRSGCIAVISSVAGDRGRKSNYVYGAAKGAVSIFLQGLRGRLSTAGVSVVTIKPGLVDTPMTAHIPKTVLFASPSYVGERIYRAMLKGANVVYVPWYWRWIMLLVKAVPEAAFKRMTF